MKKILLLLLTLFMGSTAFSQDAECEQFRKGKFKYADPDHGLTIVKRTETSQVEITEKGKIEIHSSIRWVNDCKYILKYEKIVNADVPELIGDEITVEIISNQGKKYFCRVTNESGFTATIDVLKLD